MTILSFFLLFSEHFSKIDLKRNYSNESIPRMSIEDSPDLLFEMKAKKTKQTDCSLKTDAK